MISPQGPGLLVAAITHAPDEQAADGVARQLAGIRGLHLVVDNSTTPVARERVHRACALHGVAVLGDGVNRGTAGGLNRLLAVARREGLEWILYFDQDSSTSTSYDGFTERLGSLPTDVALVGSTYDDERDVPATDLREVRYLISSGTFMRVAALTDVDGFDESLFMDLVDHEICLRLRRRGWRLMRARDLVMRHRIGAGPVARFGPLTLRRHPFWRRRLMWRNTWWWLTREGVRGMGEPARSGGVRAVETLAGAVRFRSPGFLAAAVAGTFDALVQPGRRRGLGASDAGAAASSAFGHEDRPEQG